MACWADGGGGLAGGGAEAFEAVIGFAPDEGFYLESIDCLEGGPLAAFFEQALDVGVMGWRGRLRLGAAPAGGGG